MAATFNPFTGQLDFSGMDQATADARYARLAAANIFTANGAASTPAVKLTGTVFTGGTSTSTKPHFLIEPAGTTSTGWSTDGTMFGVNAPSGFVGNLAECQLNGATRFKVDYKGQVTLGSSASAGTPVLALVTAYGSINFSSTGSNDLLMSSSVVGPVNGFLRMGFSGGTDPILQASASAWTVSQAKLVTQASTTAYAGFNLPDGTAPTSPANGDVWQDGTNFKIRIGGVTKTVTLT